MVKIIEIKNAYHQVLKRPDDMRFIMGRFTQCYFQTEFFTRLSFLKKYEHFQLFILNKSV